MAFPNRYFPVRMFGDRYYGPVEDTAQFIAVVDSSVGVNSPDSVVQLPDTGTSVTRHPTYVFVPVTIESGPERPESLEAVVDVSVSTPAPSSAPDLPVDAQDEPHVTSEVRYYVVAVESNVNERAN